MTAPIRRMQRTLAAVLAMLAAGALLFAPFPAAAQDPKSGVVQNAAREWLALADTLDATASRNAAGSRFRAAISADQWSVSLRQVRVPPGALEQRAVLSTRFISKLASAPDGDYALVVFRTTFAKRANGLETVTLEREADGGWRVIGYVIH